jgi:hypothetical protein
MKESRISSLKKVRFWQHQLNGTLTVIPDAGEKSLEVPIRRVFILTDVPVKGVRGDHAHRFCTQVVVCLHGKVHVVIDDSIDSTEMILEDPSIGLSIPPGLWNRITFEAPGTVLAVFCDEPYDPADYLRDRTEFEEYKKI